MSVPEHCLNSDNKNGQLFTDNKTGQLFSDNTSDQSDELAREEINLTNVTQKPLHNGNKGFKIMHLNIRSLIKKIDQFRIYASNNQYDIMCINETWLDDKISDLEVGIDGYDLLRKDRKRTGGGVAMYIRSSINYKIRQDVMPDYLELITVEIIKPKAKPFLLNTWYRPPDMPMEAFNDYELCLQKMDCENKEIICIGDFTKLKGYYIWLKYFNLNNLLRNLHELQKILGHKLTWYLAIDRR